MKKIVLFLLSLLTLLVTSCASSWSCQKRYCSSKQAKTIEQKKNT